MRSPAVIALSILLVLSACGGDGDATVPAKGQGTVTVESPAFADGGDIPVEFTCDGEDVSPPLAWMFEPEPGQADQAQVQEFVLTMIDADADNYVHWVVYGIPGADTRVTIDPDTIPTGAREGRNDFGDAGYGGPCPPEGDDAHRYVVTIYALDNTATADLEAGASLDDVLGAIECCVLATGTVTGTYSR